MNLSLINLLCLPLFASCMNNQSIEDVMKKHHIPGASIAIIKDFKVHSVKHYGVTDNERQEPVTSETLFQAASISKAVTTLAVLKLVQEGKLSLDQDINHVLKSWQLPGQNPNHPVTLRHLLSHTGGINVDGFAGYLPAEPMPTILEILNGDPQNGTPPVRLVKQPGEKFIYSGGGYCIIEQTVNETSGKEFPQFMKTSFFDVLGLKNSYFTSAIPDGNLHMAYGHDKTGKKIQGGWRRYPDAAGGMLTTAEDLAKIIIEIQLSLLHKSNKIISQQMAEEMLRPSGNPIYGLGFYLDGNGEYFSHNGNNVGFQTNMIAHRKSGYGVVVMTNSDQGKKLIKEVFKAVSLEHNWENFPCN